MDTYLLDHYQRSARNFFAANPMDRLVDKRRDQHWLAMQTGAESTRFVPIWRMQNFFTDTESAVPRLLTPRELPQPLSPDAMTLLGQLEGITYFALDTEVDQEDAPPAWLLKRGAFRDLRAVGLAVDPTLGAILAYARAMVYWQRRHRFCGDCGSPTRSTEGGFVRTCTNANCGKQIFPRTDPAIIVLVRSGDRCLLARQPSWPAGRYSVIAGFVEPGESLEDAVKREVMEEAGIAVGQIQYHSSQPWPFPSSLMLGFMADATTTEFHFIDDELEEARWLTREQIAAELKNGTLKLPPGLSISHRLIESWFDAGDVGKLSNLVSNNW
ncbi:MAG: NAD(+) diphosphatase [Caldilineaceae bacterium]|nr:NAD(+) diphosphatase [Caldilineaceae bacterium]